MGGEVVVFQAERLASAKALRQKRAWLVGAGWVERRKYMEDEPREEAGLAV